MACNAGNPTDFEVFEISTFGPIDFSRRNSLAFCRGGRGGGGCVNDALKGGIRCHFHLRSVKTFGAVCGFISFRIAFYIDGLCSTDGCGLTTDCGDTTDFDVIEISTFGVDFAERFSFSI